MARIEAPRRGRGRRAGTRPLRTPTVKQNRLLSRLLQEGIEGYRFSFYVISAAPVEGIQSALTGLVAADHIFGTRFEYEPASGEIRSILRVPAGYGKVAVLDELQAKLGLGSDRVVYVGDGSSDVHVMLHVNRREGSTIAVSEAKYITPIARRTVLSDDALSLLVPILEDVVGMDPPRVRAFFELHGLEIQEWDKVRTDWLTIGPNAAVDDAPAPEPDPLQSERKR